jgi:hypothetical protein
MIQDAFGGSCSQQVPAVLEIFGCLANMQESFRAGRQPLLTALMLCPAGDHPACNHQQPGVRPQRGRDVAHPAGHPVCAGEPR